LIGHGTDLFVRPNPDKRRSIIEKVISQPLDMRAGELEPYISNIQRFNTLGEVCGCCME
jgi:hypothetical protein